MNGICFNVDSVIIRLTKSLKDIYSMDDRHYSRTRNNEFL